MHSGTGILAIDLGASSGRLMFGTFASDGIAVRQIYRFSNDPVRANGKLYWDVLRIFYEIETGLRHCAEQGLKIRSIGLCSWGNTIVAIDADGDMLSTPLHYRDPAPEVALPALYAAVPREEMFRETLYKPMTIQPAVMLSYLGSEKPRLMGQTGCVLLISDFFNYLLSGIRASERTMAATSQLVDMRTGDWKTPYMERLGIREGLFPTILESGTVLGTLRGDIAREVELAGELPKIIAVSGHDTASAAGSINLCDKADSLYLSCGTWSCMGCRVDAPVEQEYLFRCGVTNDLGVCGERHLRFNHTGLWIAEECKRYWAAFGGMAEWCALLALANEATPFLAVIDTEHEVFFRKTENMPETIRRYCRETGQYVPQSEGEVLRTILESLALRYRFSADTLEVCANVSFKRLHMLGGGAKNGLLCQFTANALNLPVLAGPEEATTLGNLVQQAAALGMVRDMAEGRDLIMKSFPPTEYLPEQGEKWDMQYRKALSLHGWQV